MNSDSQREKKDGKKKKKKKGPRAVLAHDDGAAGGDGGVPPLFLLPPHRGVLKITSCFPYVTSSQQTPGIVLHRRPPLLLHFLDVCCLRSEPQGPKRPFVVRPRGEKKSHHRRLASAAVCDDASRPQFGKGSDELSLLHSQANQIASPPVQPVAHG